MNNTDYPLSTTIAQLADLLTWSENWNSYDALAPDHEAVVHAMAWVTEAYQHLAASWIEPHVTASADGAVSISWRCGQRMIEMLIDEQDIDYLQSWGRGVDAKLTDGCIHRIEDMYQLWQWLLEAQQETQL